ncbi:MAG: bifunctional adenosylcobinamide kinase/adenosylcobinamide-phosphate guanylyltransferase [Candidatus Omnitrophica bacterium]|nr:bifunctional adenosylcobinamide kinase/adenosylcobinamide-phosphate guanylyltransferase [Candidatus Omnitrophota bacterium]
MGKIFFITGGARSGKSSFAMQIAKEKSGKVAFIATCLPLDKEMDERIKLHKKKRPSAWDTFEAPKDLTPLLKEIGLKFNIIVIDCLTLFISNLLSEGLSDNAIEAEISRILKILKSSKHSSIIVSNEVGLGIVPDNKLARRFRDLQGRVNQLVAEKSKEVFFMVSGLPWRIK